MSCDVKSSVLCCFLFWRSDCRAETCAEPDYLWRYEKQA